MTQPYRALQIQFSPPFDLGEPDPSPPQGFRGFPFNIGPTLSGKDCIAQVRNGSSWLDQEARRELEIAIAPTIKILITQAQVLEVETTIHIYIRPLILRVEDDPNFQHSHFFFFPLHLG